jgi:glycine cleavage system H protein
VGPAKVAAGGEVVAINEALVASPATANTDPYGEGWLIVLRPEAWDSVKPGLVPGGQVAGPYEAKMNADGFAGCG